MTSPPISMASEPFQGWPPPALSPAGPFAEPLATLSWGVFAMGAAVLLVVVAALAGALMGRPALKATLGNQRLIWYAGLAFPMVVLSALLIWGLSLTTTLSQAPEPGEMRVRVTGEMWWWRVAYLDDQGGEAIQSANEVRIPVGEPVTFELESADVIHSFWVPRLGGKVDMIPGRRNILRLQADEAGTYGGQCAEYCGGPHALMGLVVVAMPREEFDAWLAREARPAEAPADVLAARGLAVFQDNGCGACHVVRGAPGATGLAGPDLTHVGGRRTLGAGILPNNRGTLAGWVVDSQGIKPGNRMPSYTTMSGDELQAVAAWLDGLE